MRAVRIVFAALAVATIGHAVRAQDIGSIVNQCSAAVQAQDNDRVIELAGQLIRQSGTPPISDIVSGAECLTTATKMEWRYSKSEERFVTAKYLGSMASLRMELDILERENTKAARDLKQEIASVQADIDSYRERAETVRARAQNALKDARRDLLTARTLAACERLLNQDEITGLTNPVCQQLFLQQGFPTD